jgi:type IV pilus assembly protein PilW
MIRAKGVPCACRPPRPRTARQRGYSLVELSVAMLIAIFLIGGVLVVEQGVHRSYEDNSGLSQLQDEERFAMTVITNAVESAGYYPDPTQNAPPDPSTPGTGNVLLAESSATPGNVTISFAGGQSIEGIYQSAVPNDSIAARFVGGSVTTSDLCTGSPATTGVEYTTYLYVQKAANGDSYLYCDVATNGTWATTPVQLVDGIQNMQIWYGVNTAAGTNVQSYLYASDVTAQGYWPYVTSIKVTLTLANPLKNTTNNQVQFTRVIGVMGRVGAD